jgi:Tetratricopeptide repeat
VIITAERRGEQLCWPEPWTRFSARTANLASDLALLGDFTGARELGEDTLSRLRGLVGEEHPITLGCAANLTLDLRADGAVNNADKLAADTMNRYSHTLGTDHPDAQAAAAERRLDFDFDPPYI